MARIRSVHPGLWTDERFASASPLARLLLIGIWTECDDAGSFEWSPVKLKMRVLPADNADAGELLAELEAAGCIMSYELGGRQLGAVRNFTKYQRPKKPNSTHPQTDEVRNYCGGKAASVPNQLPTGGENSPQMEDGGDNREDGGKKESRSDAAKNRGHRLSTDFEMPDGWLTWAMSERHWSRVDAVAEAASFVDYWHAKAGKDATKLDWEKTWHNWVRNSRRLSSVPAKRGGDDDPNMPLYA